MFQLTTSTTSIVIIFNIVLLAECVSSHGWNYISEDQWPIDCQEGRKQSPIALSTDIAEEANFPSLIFEQYDVTYPVQSKNNGHSLEIRLHVQNQPTVKGGGLPNLYVLDHLHFHWESEHTMDDIRFPLELHLVHYASGYPNVSEALKHTDGVAVFSVLFYISPDNDEQFNPLVEVIDKIQNTIDAVQELHIKINDYLPRDKAGFYRYNGSLTTPGCTEGVIWTVFTNKIPISKAQVDSFPLLKADGSQQTRTVVKNYRSLQKLNGRRIQIRSSPIYSSGISYKMNAVLQKLLIVIVLANIFVFI